MKNAARYGARAPLALSRLTYNREKQEITYTYTNPYDHTNYTEKLTPHELIARLMTHIPNRGEHTNHNFGYYANRTRGNRKSVHGSRQIAAEEMEVHAPTHWRKKWAELLHLVFEVHLTCPRCGTEMKILSFITEREPIRKILTHMKQKGIGARAGSFTDSAA